MMVTAPGRYLVAAGSQPTALPTVWYSILGVPVSVASDVIDALQCVDDTYAGFRSTARASGAAIALQLQRLNNGTTFRVSDTQGYERDWPAQQAAVVDLLDHLVHMLLAQLQTHGVYVSHAGVVRGHGGALMLVGPSGHGKTTLVLGLLRRGLQLLSDEFAVIAPTSMHILPYQRSLHIRPGTLELIPELGVIGPLPRQHVGELKWILAPQDLEQVLPGCLGEAAPLQSVLLLAGVPQGGERPVITPVPSAVAAVEVLRSTWAAAVDFDGALSRMTSLLKDARCARLRAGTLDATVDAIVSWLEAPHG